MDETRRSLVSSDAPLILVVGPSGVGKDTLVAGAKRQLIEYQILFAVRDVTRPGQSLGETDIHLSEVEFARRLAAGQYALHWRAHGYFYGVPTSIQGDLEAGTAVVVIASRAIIHAARSHFRAVRVILIVAQPKIVADRLRRRGREGSKEIIARTDRNQVGEDGLQDIVLNNNGSVEDGVDTLAAAIRACVADYAHPSGGQPRAK